MTTTTNSANQAASPITPPMQKGMFDSADGGKVEAFYYTLNGTSIVDPYRSTDGLCAADPERDYGITKEAADALVKANSGKNLMPVG